MGRDGRCCDFHYHGCRKPGRDHAQALMEIKLLCFGAGMVSNRVMKKSNVFFVIFELGPDQNCMSN